MRKASLLAGIAAMTVGSFAGAQTFGPGPGGAIPDRGVSGVGPPTIGSLTSTIVVPAGTGSIVSFDNVSITMGSPTGGATGGHTFLGDLVFTLTAPNLDTVQILSRTGATSSTSFGSGDDFVGGPFVFVDSGGLNFVTTAAAAGNIAPGTYNRFSTPAAAPNPANDVDTYAGFVGDVADGTWTLTVSDWAGGDTGGLASWSLSLTVPEPASMGLLAVGAVFPLLRRRR
jgi:hypothetical protein